MLKIFCIIFSFIRRILILKPISFLKHLRMHLSKYVHLIILLLQLLGHDLIIEVLIFFLVLKIYLNRFFTIRKYFHLSNKSRNRPIYLELSLLILNKVTLLAILWLNLKQRKDWNFISMSFYRSLLKLTTSNSYN